MVPFLEKFFLSPLLSPPRSTGPPKLWHDFCHKKSERFEMLAIILSLVLGLASAPALALSGDVAAVVETRLVGQQAAPAIESELAAYLDDDDIAGAQAYIADLAERGEIEEAERRALEDRIWRTKTERTLEYARKIREAIQASDLDAMRDYNARMQRLTRTGAVQALPVEGLAETVVLETETPAAVEAESIEEEAAVVDEEDAGVGDDAAPPEADDNAAVIADLVRRGEVAIEVFNLSIAGPGKDSALGMIDKLLPLGDQGKAAAEGLGRRVMAVYKSLIERDIGRDRLDKAATFARRMGEVAERVGLPRDEVDALKTRIYRASAGRQEHERLMQQATRLRDEGKLVAPGDEHALASAAAALKLGIDPDAAAALLDDIIVKQRSRVDGMVNDGRFRVGAAELNGLGDALLAANVGETALVADLRAKAFALDRRAELSDQARESAKAVGTPGKLEEATEADDNDRPLTFINPF